MGVLADRGSPIADIPQDASIIVAGPPMTGKYTLMLTIIAYHADDAIIISTKNGSSRVVDDLSKISGGQLGGRLGIVDCVSRPETLNQDDSELIKHVQSPENLTRIGVKFTELFEKFYEDGSEKNTAVGVHSISQLLMHSELKNVYQFLQVLTGQIRTANWLGVAVVDTNISKEDLQTLYHHFDGMVETRENAEGQRELRVRGIEPTASAWTQF